MQIKNQAFTLIESLLYLAIAATMLVAVMGFLTAVLQARVKYQTISEVEQQGAFAMSAITQTLRGAQTINLPNAGSSGSQLSVSGSGFPGNPIVFNNNSGTLTETIGSQSGIALTGPNITLSNLSFSNLSSSGSPGLIRVEFTVSYNSPSAGQEYNYQANFYDSASLRY